MKQKTRTIGILLCLSGLTVLMIAKLRVSPQPAQGNLKQEESIRKDGRTVSRPKLILAYTTVYGREFDIVTYGRTGHEISAYPDPLAACEYKCSWTTDKSKYAISDAVLFHLYNNLNNKDFVISKLPKRQDFQQKWILMAREPQAFYLPNQLEKLDELFNLTITFQRSSDVWIPYGNYWPLPETSKAIRTRSNTNYLKGKTKLVVWIASNCRTSSRREEYVKDLQKYIHIDIYGKCGNLKTPTNSANGFRDQVAKEYMFYIAFENSDCNDYISEKFWNSLHNGLIPIVRGNRANYKDLAPPNSYIQVEKFISAEKLAEHLKELSTNSTLFNKYHEWRKEYDANYKFFTTNSMWICDLCKQVHVSTVKTVKVSEHFGEDSQCFTYLSHYGRNRTNEHVENLDCA